MWTMKILMVNKFHYIKGGSETYYFALKRKLEEEGHSVIDFSMKDEKNFDSPYSDYFVENVDYGSDASIVAKIKLAKNIIYSKEAKDKFESLVVKEKPDLVHLHIFQHQLSPSILDICKEYNLPTVYTAHDLKMICLNYKMMHHGKICEDCKDGHLYHCLVNKCVKNSFTKSLINVCEGYFHKMRKSYDAIDYIITPSNFYRRKFIDFGIDLDRVVHIPNFLDREIPKVGLRNDSKKYFLYLGRLSEEKGIITLIKAMRGIDAYLYVVGTGPLKEEILKYINIHRIKNVKMLGFKSGQELIDIVGNAKSVILPSEWYENGPYSAIEALQLGRPIIGANIGGIPELIDGNGYLFESGNAGSLHEVLMKFEDKAWARYSELEFKSEEMFRKNYTAKTHVEKLKKIYSKAVERHNEG